VGLNNIAKGALPKAADIQQLINILQALYDAGPLSFLGSVSAPSTAPTATLSSGSLNGSYQWGTYWITGIPNGSGGVNVTGRTTPSPYSTSISLTNQQGTVSISGQGIPQGVIGWGVVRNHAGGSVWYEVPGSEQFNLSGLMPVTFIDNTSDANLITSAPSTNTTGTPVTFGAPVTFDSPVYLNGVDNVNAPPTPVILASSNIQGVGMTEFGDLVPINPSQIQSGTYWTVKDKNGNPMWKVYLSGGAIDCEAYWRCYGGLYVPSGQSTWLCNGIGWNYTWSGTINTGTSTTLTHNLGHYPIVALAGTTGNLELTYRFQDLETIVVTNYSSGGNNWTGGVYLL
jgi:hypothetical protein